jgi:hypothetical protein
LDFSPGEVVLRRRGGKVWDLKKMGTSLIRERRDDDLSPGRVLRWKGMWDLEKLLGPSLGGVSDRGRYGI